MARISDIPKAKLQLTEQTVHELHKAIIDAKENLDPLPDCIMVTSPYGQVEFQIELEFRPHTQESMGYRKTKDIHYNQCSGVLTPKKAIEKEPYDDLH